MCHDDPFTQRNKATKRAVGVEVGGEGVEMDKTWKMGVVNIVGGLHSIRRLGTLCQLCKENLKTGCYVSSG